MSGLIASPLFRSNNTEKLEAADAYTITDTRPINKLYEAAKAGAHSLINSMGSPQQIGASISRLVAMKKQGASGRELLEASLGAFGTSIEGVLRTAGTGLLDKAASFIDLDPSIANRIKIGGVFVAESLLTGNVRQLGELQTISGLLGDLGLPEEYLDYVNVGIESAVWAAALTGATSINIFDYFEKLKDHVDDDVYYQAVVFTLPTVATMGSLEGLQAVINGIGAWNILANQPDFIPTFISNFMLPNPLPDGFDAREYGIRLVNLLNQIDPMWYKYQRTDTEVILDLKYLTNPSKDAVTVLELHDELGVAVMLAPGYPEKSVNEVMREQFPRMAVV